MKFDCVVATDAASLERLGSVGRCVTTRKLLINIDHHESNTRFGDLNWVSAHEPSTGELVFRLLKIAKWPITKRIADCLFTAVSTDTGSFQYASTRPGTYHVAGELVSRGADLAKICDEVYQSYPLSRVRLLRHIYSHFRLTHEDQIAYFWLRKADLARTGADSSDSEGLIDHIRAIAPVVVACVFEEIDEEREGERKYHRRTIRRWRPPGRGGRAHSRQSPLGAAQSHRRHQESAQRGGSLRLSGSGARPLPVCRVSASPPN
jgi:phosphoesterase RecJ-like protein